MSSVIALGGACLRGQVECSHHPSGRAAQKGTDRLLRRLRGREAASSRVRDPQTGAQGFAQMLQIAAHSGADVSVDHHGAGALVLPVLRQKVAGHGEKRRAVEGAECLGDQALVLRVPEREQERYGDRFGPAFSHAPGDASCVLGAQGDYGVAVTVEALSHAEAELRRHQLRRGARPQSRTTPGGSAGRSPTCPRIPP